MTSTPASRSALATTFAPRSWPSSPALAMTTLIAMTVPPASSGSVTARWRLQLLQGGIAQDEMLDAVVATEVDLGFGAVVGALHVDHRAEAELVVVDLVPRLEREDRAVTG